MKKSPDYKAQVGEALDDDNRTAWIAMRAAEASREGCIFARVSRHPTMENLTLFEAWTSILPDQLGEPEWMLTAVDAAA